MLNSTRASSIALIAMTSPGRMWRWSGRGCTVMPCAPAAMHACAAAQISGWSPPRELRSTAILLTFTLSKVMTRRSSGNEKSISVSMPPHSRHAPVCRRRLALAAGQVQHDGNDATVLVALENQSVLAVGVGETVGRVSAHGAACRTAQLCVEPLAAYRNAQQRIGVEPIVTGVCRKRRCVQRNRRPLQARCARAQSFAGHV